jgi:hypothetical protein
MIQDDAERYALEVRDRVFGATVRAIADQMHPKGVSESARSLSFNATIDALLKVVAELVAEAQVSTNPVVQNAILANLNHALEKHFENAKRSIAEHESHRARARRDLN